MEVASISASFNAGEHKYRVINVSLEPSVANKTVRLALITPKGNRFLSDPLEVTDGKAAFRVPSAVLDGKGRLYAQAVAYDKGEFIAKSRAVHFSVDPSLDDWKTDGGDGVVSPEDLADGIYETNKKIEESNKRIDELAADCFALVTELEEFARKDSPPVLITSLKGKKWAVIGDGQTEENSHKTVFFPNLVSSVFGISTVLNYGEDGSTITRKTKQETDSICVRAAMIPSDVDIITVFGGMEDMRQNMTLGKFGNTDTTTFYGALESLCSSLVQRFPGKPMFFVTPISYASPLVNKSGISMKLFATAVCEVCAKYSIPVLDMYSGGSIYMPLTGQKAYFSQDGVYLNDNAQRHFANAIVNFLLTLPTVQRTFYDGNGQTSPAPAPATSVRLNKKELTLVEGEAASLTAAVSPSNAANKNVTWTSEPLGITLTPNGRTCSVTGTPGRYYVTCHTVDGNRIATCIVTITALPVHVTSVTLDSTSKTLSSGGSFVLSATVAPADADDKSVTWSTDSDCVTLVPNGASCTVFGLSPGTARVTCTASDNGKSSACTVTVTSGTIAVTGVSLNLSACSVKKNASKTLTATVAPSDATNKSVAWSVSNSNATISPDGNKCTVTGASIGSCTVTCTTADGSFSASCTVSVTAPSVPVTGIQMSEASISLAVGSTHELTAALIPSNATNNIIIWESSDGKVTLDDDSGLTCTVTGVSAGLCTVTATTADGGFEAVCNVTVE